MTGEPEEATSGESPPGSRPIGWIVLLWLVAGLVIGFHPVLRFGFEMPLAGYPDSQLTSFLLEHGHRSVLGAGELRSVWRPPIFHPFPESGALSETLLGVLPFYSPARLLGASPATAAMVAQVLMSIATFLLAFVLYRRGLDASVHEAGFAAFLVAFGAAKMARIYHLQLFAQVPFFLALVVLQRLLTQAVDRPVPRAGIIALGLLAVAQFYSCVYIVLLALVLAIPILIFLGFFPEERRLLGRRVASRWPWWIGAAAGAAALLAPLLLHYSAASEVVQRHGTARLGELLPPALSILNSGARSWLGGRFALWTGVPQVPFSWEFSLGMGFVATALALAGLGGAMRRPWLRLLLASSALAWLVLVRWPGGFSVWGALLEVAPGVGVLRAVSRLYLLILPVLAAAAMLGLRRVRERWGSVLAACLALVVVLEQGRDWGMREPAPTLDVEAVAASIPESCDALFLTAIGEGTSDPQIHLAAMWAALRAGVPTINGYSGYLPEGWRLSRVREPPAAEGELRERLGAWLDASGFTGEVCWLRADSTRGSERIDRLERLNRP